MKFNELLILYNQFKDRYGNEAYKHISELLKKAKELHKKDFSKSSTAEKARREGRTPDHEQSWRAFKGKNLEKLITHIIKKVMFITPDEDKTLTIKRPAKKGRAIVEKDTDGCYVMSEEPVEESSKVKMFDKFIDDLKKILSN